MLRGVLVTVADHFYHYYHERITRIIVLISKQQVHEVLLRRTRLRTFTKILPARVGLQRDGLFHRRRQVRVYRAKDIDDFSIDRDKIGIFEPNGRVTRRYRHRIERGHHGYVFEIWIDDGVVDADSVRASERRDFGWGFLEREE